MILLRLEGSSNYYERVLAEVANARDSFRHVEAHAPQPDAGNAASRR